MEYSTHKCLYEYYTYIHMYTHTYTHTSYDSLTYDFVKLNKEKE